MFRREGRWRVWWTAGLVLWAAAAGARPASAEARGAAEFASLQQRMIAVYESSAAAIVRVKGAIEEGVGEDGRPRVALRVGTGFFISREGHVLTNASIVSGVNRLWVEYGGFSHAAELLGVEPETNFALVRLVELPANFGVLAAADDVPPPLIGSMVLAVTAPLEFAPTPSLGLVSGSDGSFGERSFPLPLLRVTIAANPGEGGSPVLDLNGRLVGMMIASLPEVRSSYVLPVRAVRRLRDDILFHGGPRPGWVGFDLGERPVRAAPAGREVVVTGVLPDTPAARAGLQAGDVLVRIDRSEVLSMNDVRTATFYSRVGQLVVLAVRREGVLREVAVQVAPRPAPPATAQTEPGPPPGGG